ncbi:Ig-like domain-containing protein [Flaviaesturariibacter amylovorans]
MKKVLFLFPAALLLAFALFGGAGCANIVPPLGGPRDSLPPRVVKVTPGDSSLNFRGNEIVVQFDEYVDYTPGSVLFTPLFEKPAEITARLRTLTIKLRDSLEPNTTYNLNFGEAIKDFNEGNVLRGYTYTFSTGPYLDSLTLSGSVDLAETGTIDTTLTMLLYRNLDDSAVVKERPRYITRLNSEGRFTFRNLPSGTFALYALGDPQNARRYQNKSQLFAFTDSPIVVRPGTPDVLLHAYQETKAATTAGTTSGAPGAPGSKGPPQPATDRRLKYTPVISGDQDLQRDFQINFANKVTRLDSTKVRLTVDTTYTPVPFRLSLDSTARVLSVRSAWRSGAQYQLLLDKDFATDSTGRSQLRTDTVRFAAKSTSDYGRLVLRFRGIDPKLNPVLQFVLNGTVQFSAPISSGTLNRDFFEPGDYELRVLFDRNGNGTWDPGRFFEGRRQPELVRPVERRLNVKPDIDTEVEIDIPGPDTPAAGSASPAPNSAPAPANPAPGGNRPAQTPSTPPPGGQRPQKTGG